MLDTSGAAFDADMVLWLKRMSLAPSAEPIAALPTGTGSPPVPSAASAPGSHVPAHTVNAPALPDMRLSVATTLSEPDHTSIAAPAEPSCGSPLGRYGALLAPSMVLPRISTFRDGSTRMASSGTPSMWLPSTTRPSAPAILIPVYVVPKM